LRFGSCRTRLHANWVGTRGLVLSLAYGPRARLPPVGRIARFDLTIPILAAVRSSRHTFGVPALAFRCDGQPLIRRRGSNHQNLEHRAAKTKKKQKKKKENQERRKEETRPHPTRNKKGEKKKAHPRSLFTTFVAKDHLASGCISASAPTHRKGLDRSLRETASPPQPGPRAQYAPCRPQPLAPRRRGDVYTNDWEAAPPHSALRATARPNPDGRTWYNVLGYWSGT